MDRKQSIHSVARCTPPRCLPHSYVLTYLLEQDVLGGLSCVAYSTSSSPWEAEYCSLWVAQRAQSGLSCSGPAAHQTALTDSATFDHPGCLRLPRTRWRRDDSRLRQDRGRNPQARAWLGARVLHAKRDPRPRPGVRRAGGDRLGVRDGSLMRCCAYTPARSQED